MPYTKLEFKGTYSNPGFELGEVVYWDNKVVPLKFQPYPFIGKITNIHAHGCFVFNRYSDVDEGYLFYDWKRLCEIGALYRGEKA